MQIGIFINARTPYRQKQLTKISEIERINGLNIYYTHPEMNLRKWKVEGFNTSKIKETALPILLKTRLGNLNKGIYKVIKDNNLIILTGYDQPSYVITALICILFKKPYIIIIDGVNPKKCLVPKKNLINILKSIILKNSSAIFGNGKVTKKNLINYNCEKKLFNQYLTVDVESIKERIIKKDFIRDEIRKRYGIRSDDIVILYSGRVLKMKNVQSLIRAIEQLNLSNIKLFVAGGGEYEKDIVKLAKELKVDLTVTGFIEDQQELFDYYFMADIFTLISFNEVWGLVINEAMAAELPIIASLEVGAVYDLVTEDNGLIVDPNDIQDIKEKIIKLVNDKSLRERMGKESGKIISEWTFDSSKKSFENMLNFLNI